MHIILKCIKPVDANEIPDLMGKMIRQIAVGVTA
jgi:hypothetical protein